MSSPANIIDIAIKHHDALPNRIRVYLNRRGIPDEIIDAHLLGWNGWRITIPIYNRAGLISFFKLAKDPQDSRPSPKMLTSPGGTVELYGWENLVARSSPIIVCEGEFDRLVLEAQGFAAVTSTAGAACFRPEWATELKNIDEVYVCFDRDRAGINGAGVVSVMVPHAKFVELPVSVGEGGDVTDFFATLGRSKDEFTELLGQATSIPPTSLALQLRPRPTGIYPNSFPLGALIERIKRDLPIEELIGKYVKLELSPIRASLVGRCPFHNDRFTRSFTVYPRSRAYYCFGCRARGDVIGFLAAKEYISFGEAVEKLDLMISQNGEPSETSRKDEAA